MGTNDQTPIFWLASYPKTGSTWVREILANCLQEEKRNLAIPSFQKEWPEVKSKYKLRGQSCHIVKTHLYPKHKRMSQVPHETCGAILVRRHPLDILLSAINYALLKDVKHVFINESPKDVESIIADGEFLHYINEFRETDGFSWFSGPSGELSLYMDRWRSALPDKEIHEIVYEDLFANPHQEVRKLLEFSGIESSDDFIDNVVRTSDEKTKQNGKFFWKRRSYNFEELLSDKLISDFYEMCEPQLKGMGYSKTQNTELPK